MTDHTIYAAKRKRGHIDRLYNIANLAKVGAAATDTLLDLDDMDAAQCTLWEVVYTLASEAIEIAELAQKSGKS